MAHLNENGDWINGRGKPVPVNLIDPVVKRREKTIDRIVKIANRLETRMKKDKEMIIKIILAHMEYLEKRNKVKANKKGNIQLTGFSGDRRVEYKLQDLIQFDERLELAKALIYQCIEKWSVDSGREIRAIIDEAFGTGKKNINVSSILKLRHLKFKDEDWQKAMDLITDSIMISTSRSYLRILLKNGDSDKFKSVNLNFSNM